MTQGVRIALTDGAAHAVDSSEMAFKLACQYAFRCAAGPTLFGISCCESLHCCESFTQQMLTTEYLVGSSVLLSPSTLGCLFKVQNQM